MMIIMIIKILENKDKNIKVNKCSMDWTINDT